MIKDILKYWYVFVFLLLISIFFIFNEFINNKNINVIDNSLEEINEVDENDSLENINVEIQKYYVDIKGEVKNPGVYEIDSDKRVIDVVLLAGGFTKNADTSLLNLSKKIIDEMNIKIYSKEEVKKLEEKINSENKIINELENNCICKDVNVTCEVNNDALIDEDNNDLNNQEENNLININTASYEILLTIPGIGDAKATSIIEYRKSNTFNTIEDIKNVSGIGDSIFESIKQYITV